MCDVRSYYSKDLEDVLALSEDFFAGEGDQTMIPLYFGRDERLKTLMQKLTEDTAIEADLIRDKLENTLCNEDYFLKNGPRLRALSQMQSSFGESMRAYLSPTQAVVSVNDQKKLTGALAYHPVVDFMKHIESLGGLEASSDVIDHSGYIPFVLSDRSLRGVGKLLVEKALEVADCLGHKAIYTHAWTGSYSPELFLSHGFKVLDVVTGASPDGAPSFFMKKDL